jgi:hypothetical protein
MLAQAWQDFESQESRFLQAALAGSPASWPSNKEEVRFRASRLAKLLLLGAAWRLSPSCSSSRTWSFSLLERCRRRGSGDAQQGQSATSVPNEHPAKRDRIWEERSAENG